MLEQRYRHQQFQDMMQRVQREHQNAEVSQKEAPKNGAAKPKGETLLAKAAREQMMHLEALQNSLNTNTSAEDDQGQNSGRSDEGQKSTNKKRRRRAGKK